MIERTISQSMHDNRLKELDETKEAIYKENIDNLTCRMTRKKTNGTWTEQDEQSYKEADAKCKALIAEQENPLNLWNADKIVVVSDEEYEKLIGETKEEIKETPKEEPVEELVEEPVNNSSVKDSAKDSAKDEIKDEIKDETKDTVKDEMKEAENGK